MSTQSSFLRGQSEHKSSFQTERKIKACVTFTTPALTKVPKPRETKGHQVTMVTLKFVIIASHFHIPLNQQKYAQRWSEPHREHLFCPHSFKVLMEMSTDSSIPLCFSFHFFSPHLMTRIFNFLKFTPKKKRSTFRSTKHLQEQMNL